MVSTDRCASNHIFTERGRSAEAGALGNRAITQQTGHVQEF